MDITSSKKKGVKLAPTEKADAAATPAPRLSDTAGKTPKAMPKTVAQASLSKTKRFNFLNFHTFRWRILLSYIIVSLIPLSVFYVSVTTVLENYFFEQREKEVLRQAGFTASQIQRGDYILDESKLPLLDTDIKQTSIANNLRIIVTDKMGTVVSDSSKVTDVDGKVIQGDVGKTYFVPEVIDALNEKDFRYHTNETVSAATAVIDNNNTVIGTVVMYASLLDVVEMLSAINSAFALFTVVIGLIIVVLSYWMSNIIVDPLKSMLSVIQKMSDGHLEQRVRVRGRNEISELGTSFNTMAERLEKVEQTRREFVSNVSHELKTPLSSIKVLSESILLQEQVPAEMYQEFLVDIRNEVDRMTNIINDLLDLVKLDRTAAPLKLSSVHINKTIEDILKRLAPLAKQKEIELIFESLKDVTTQVDEVKLSLAITNLIENGIKYTPEGGMVTVSVDADHQNAFIQVRDSGVGMAEDEISKIFDRFYRIDKTRDRETGGSGLGLAITHSVIMMHNGSIRVMSKENEGSLFSVRLPLTHTAT